MNKVVIVPGNGCTNIMSSNWYGWLTNELRNKPIDTINTVVCRNMPDPFGAKRSIWIPFMKNELEIDERTIAIGHSSGAEALLRYAETDKVGAIVLVSACWSDLGDKGERESGYYPAANGDNAWKFDQMKLNCDRWFQFHSDNDPFIPIDEAELVRTGLGLEENSEFFLLPGRSHFFDYPFPELLDLVKQIAQTCKLAKDSTDG